MSLRRFVCITTLPPEISTQIRWIRAKVSAISGAEEALAYPPHVTLRTGFLVPEDVVGSFFEDFRSLAASLSSFAMRASGLRAEAYEAEGERRLILGLDVELDEPFRKLHEALLGFADYAKGPQYEFRPHLTLAFHDLTNMGFENALAWLKALPSVSASSFKWRCDNVCLYSRPGWEWVERLRITLSS